MDMSIALMATQRHEVYSLGRERRFQCLGHVVDNIVDLAEQLTVAGYIDYVGTWRDDRVPQQCGVPAEKRHHAIVGIDCLVHVSGMAIQISTNKTRPSLRALHMCGKIEFRHDRFAPISGLTIIPPRPA